eukprot:10839031-Alexandrium_andersonii.AAC.1
MTAVCQSVHHAAEQLAALLSDPQHGPLAPTPGPACWRVIDAPVLITGAAAATMWSGSLQGSGGVRASRGWRA